MNMLGLGLSYLFVIVVLGVAFFALKKLHADSFNTRKIVHISVSNWWFFLLYFFDSIEYAIIGPISFIILNYLSYRYHLMPAMELKDNRKNLGTVYFPISLLVLVLLGYGGIMPLYMGGIGILILGYGDGLAAVVGKRWGKRTFRVSGGTKSLAGTLTMFIVSALVVLLGTLGWYEGSSLLTGEFLLLTMGTAAAATLVELFTPWGIDNITVPLVGALVYRLLAGAG